MAITLKVTGNGQFGGAETSISDYNITEDATPIDPTDNTGGVGTLTFSVLEDDGPEGTVLLLGDTVELEDGSNGRTRGVVTVVDGTAGLATISADSRMTAMLAPVTAEAFSGTLSAAINYYFGLVGLTAGISIDTSIASRSVAYPEWTEVLWDQMKSLCAAQQIEITLISSNIVVRPLRTRIAQASKLSNLTSTAQRGEQAQLIEVYCYNTFYSTNSLAYPHKDVTDTVIELPASYTLQLTVPISASLKSVQQPIAIDPSTFVESLSAPISTYVVLDSRDHVVLPQLWEAGGGQVTAKLGVEVNTLDLSVTASANIEFAPYKLALVSDPAMSSLRLYGEGVFIDKQLIAIPTGADPNTATKVVGATVDNPFITTKAQAYTAGMNAAGSWGGAKQSISADVISINRPGQVGSARYPTFAEVNAQNAGTFATFNSQWTGQTFKNASDYYFALVADDFENQAFGNGVGSRFPFRENWYRILTATFTPGNVSFTAARDTTFGDVAVVRTGKTFAQVNTLFTGKTFADVGVIPLWV